MTLERSAYQAWKSRDARFWDTFLWDNFVGYGSSGKLDKASAKREYAGADCEIKSYVLSDEQMRPLGDDAALLTYKVTVDGACGRAESSCYQLGGGRIRPRRRHLERSLPRRGSGCRSKDFYRNIGWQDGRAEAGRD